MKLFGFNITRANKPRAPSAGQDLSGEKAFTSVPGSNRGGWFRILEPYGGAWQENIEVNSDTVLTYSAVYSCITLIASDIGKLRIRLMRQDASGIWSEAGDSPFWPVLRKPNRYQTRVKFFESWVTSKLINGNTYVLKERDARGVVTGLYVLDPTRTRPLVADDGSIFYELSSDNLTGIRDSQLVVPASEIIHDTMVTLYHPLVGVSPLHASGLAATQGIQMQRNSTKFFGNGARPAGILTAPGRILPETAERIKQQWETNYGGANIGRTAVLGDGLSYQPTAVTAIDAQYIEQLRWTAEQVCSTFHVPLHKVGVGQNPTYNNIEALDQQYYSQCLQGHIESIELALDEGLSLPRPYGVEFDLDDLLRMDTATKVKAAAEAVGAGFLSPDEARAKFDLKPVKGGGTPYLQQQNYSLAALDERDKNAPLAQPIQPTQPPPQASEDDEPDAAADEQARAAWASEIFHRAAKFDARDAA